MSIPTAALHLCVRTAVAATVLVAYASMALNGAPASARSIVHTSGAQARSTATQSALERRIPMTAARLALLHGVTTPSQPLGAHNRAGKAPCPNAYYEYKPDPSFRYIGWTDVYYCTCACVFVTRIPTAPEHQCTSCMILSSFIGHTKISVIGFGSSSSYSPELDLSTKAFKEIGIITNGLTGSPIGLAQDAKENTYVSACCSSNQVLVYPNNASEPAQAYTDANLSSVYWLAVDKKADLFVDGYNAAGTFEVDEMPAESGKFIPLQGIQGETPGGLALDAKGNLWVSDQGNGISGTLSGYAPPYQQPHAQFATDGSNTEISIDSTSTMLVAANNFIDGSTLYSQAVTYAIPSGDILSTTPANPGETWAVGFKQATKI